MRTYNQGWNARRNDQPDDANPYHRWTPAFDDWLEGWKDCDYAKTYHPEPRTIT